MEDLASYIGALLWNFWTVAIGVVLAMEPIVRWFWPRYDAWASAYLTARHRRFIKYGAAVFAFVFANYLVFHDVSRELRAANARLGTTSPQKIAELQAQLDA